MIVEAGCGGRPPTGRRRGFHSHAQCQICGRFNHLAYRCYYRFNRDYSGPASVARPSPSIFVDPTSSVTDFGVYEGPTGAPSAGY
ncbi:hypothetical protein J1N35_007342 [Gossypium stocksii]|uniref:Uncharacterized protein n=1 Tax=Gossypium stocksii TaxID=47602 RepID=A0A9D3W5V7_9ROSI|nr:hypothetical protein J1N35_007342 [Gossypium stocksii]